MSAGRRERDNPRVGQQPSRVVAAPRRDNRRTNLDTGRMPNEMQVNNERTPLLSYRQPVERSPFLVHSERCCLLSCVPCADTGCLCLWQIIAWLGLLPLAGLTVYELIKCNESELQSTNIVILIILGSIALVAISCLLHHCCYVRGSLDSGRCFVYFCGTTFAVIFLLAVAAGTFFVFYENFNTIIDDHVKNTTRIKEIVSGKFDCDDLFIMPLLVMCFSYIAIFLYICLWVTCVSYQNSVKKKDR